MFNFNLKPKVISLFIDFIQIFNELFQLHFQVFGEIKCIIFIHKNHYRA